MSDANRTSPFGSRRRLVLAAEQHLERIARLHLALEIHVVGVDANEIVDHRARHLLAQRRLVDALVEAHAAARIVLVLLRLGDLRVGALHVHRDVLAGIGQRDHRLDRAVGGDDDPDRLQALRAAGRAQEHAQLLAVLETAVATAHAERAGNGLDLLRSRAELAQDRADRVALLHRDGALVPGIAAGRLGRGLRQLRDVLGDDALERK